MSTVDQPEVLSERTPKPMRKRGRSIIMDGGHHRENVGHSTSGPPVGYVPGPGYRFNETPEEWRRHAHEPWRILFPDLEWTPPDRDL